MTPKEKLELLRAGVEVINAGMSMIQYLSISNEVMGRFGAKLQQAINENRKISEEDFAAAMAEADAADAALEAEIARQLQEGSP